MDFALSDKARSFQSRLSAFMDEAVYPAETTYAEQLASSSNRWESPPIMDELKARARAAGLWNLFLPGSHHGAGLTNVEYAPLGVGSLQAELQLSLLVPVEGDSGLLHEHFPNDLGPLLRQDLPLAPDQGIAHLNDGVGEGVAEIGRVAAGPAQDVTAEETRPCARLHHAEAVGPAHRLPHLA